MATPQSGRYPGMSSSSSSRPAPAHQFPRIARRRAVLAAARSARVRSGGMLFYSDDAASHPAERFRQLCPALGLEVHGFEEDRRLNLPFYLFVAARA